MTRSAFAVAERFKHAIEAKARERERYGKADIVHYNVFVITGTLLIQLIGSTPPLIESHRTFLRV